MFGNNNPRLNLFVKRGLVGIFFELRKRALNFHENFLSKKSLFLFSHPWPVCFDEEKYCQLNDSDAQPLPKFIYILRNTIDVHED